MKDYNWGWCSGHSSQRGGGIDNAEVVIRIDAMIKLADYMEKYNREQGRSQPEVVDSASPRVYSSLLYVISLCRIHLGCAPRRLLLWLLRPERRPQLWSYVV
jgi:hypothetical protein